MTIVWNISNYDELLCYTIRYLLAQTGKQLTSLFYMDSIYNCHNITAVIQGKRVANNLVRKTIPRSPDQGVDIPCSVLQ